MPTWPPATHQDVTDRITTYTGRSSVEISVATRSGGIPLKLSGTGYAQPSETTKTLHVATADLTSLDLYYLNVYNNAGTLTDGTSVMTIRCAVQTFDGLSVSRGYSPMTGSRTVTVDPGGMGHLIVPVVIPAGTKFYILSYVSVPAAGQWTQAFITNHVAIYPGGAPDTTQTGQTTSAGEGSNIAAGGADVTNPGAAAVPARYGFGFGPSYIVGRTARGTAPTCVGISGDSIANGAGDWPNLGYIIRAFGTTQARMQFSMDGELTTTYANPQTRSWRSLFLQYCTHAIFGFGRNDLTAGATLTQIQTRMIAGWTALVEAGIITYQTTVTPYTTSTDVWTTLANQTVHSSETVRVALNTWIRDGAPILAGVAAATGSNAVGTLRAGAVGHPLKGYLEVTDTVESARNSGKWTVAKVRSVADVTMTLATYDNQITVNSATAAFTAADVGKLISIAGAAAAGAAHNSMILKVNSATQAIIFNPIATAVTNASTKIGMTVIDGLHPGPDANADMAAAIPLSSFQ